jgi:hypothetical protein
MAVVIYLRIGYHSDAWLREFHVALSSEDLDSLRTVVERAQVKTEVLSRYLERTKMQELGKEDYA